MAVGDVFATEEGDRTVKFRQEQTHAGDVYPLQYFGWRERPDGSRERVTYSDRLGRWQTSQEVF